MFKLLFSNIKTIASIFFGFFSLFILGRNNKLSRENEKLNNQLKQQRQTIDIQKKVIDVTKTTKAKPLSGNLKRMRKNKL